MAATLPVAGGAALVLAALVFTKGLVDDEAGGVGPLLVAVCANLMASADAGCAGGVAQGLV